MAIDISELSFDDLTKLEKQIKTRKKEMHDINEAFYKSDATPWQASEICRRRFPPELYPESKIHHLQNVERTELDFKAYAKLQYLILNLCDLIIGNYTVKNDKLMFKGSIVSRHAKEYLRMAEELGELIHKYDRMIFENGKEI